MQPYVNQPANQIKKQPRPTIKRGTKKETVNLEIISILKGWAGIAIIISQRQLDGDED